MASKSSHSSPALSAAETTLQQRLTEASVIPSPDLLVIGAELTGLLAASLAADKGLKVQVLTESPLLETTSSQLPGLIWPSSLAGRSSEALREFAFFCRDLWSRLTVRPGMDFEWKVPGVLALGGPSGIPHWSDKLSDFQADGWSIQSVDAEQLAQLLPGWNRPSDQGLFFPADGQIHPASIAISLARNLFARKSSIRLIELTEQFETSPEGRFSLLNTPLGEIRPKFVLWNLNRLPPKNLSGNLPNQPETFLKGFAPTTTSLCSLPIIADQLTLIPRPFGCEVFLELAPNEHPAGEQLQKVWGEVVTRWNPTPPPLQEVATITHEISSAIPALHRIAPEGNLWQLVPGAGQTSTLYAAGLAQSFVEWITSGQRPDRLDSLSG